MEESRRARTLAQERLRTRLELSKAKAEQDQKEKEEDVQKRIQVLLSLKQNADSALAELKAANERYPEGYINNYTRPYFFPPNMSIGERRMNKLRTRQDCKRLLLSFLKD
jgi:hypothetical protein